MNRRYIIKYSEITSIPFVGNIIFLVQLVLIYLELSHTFLFSRQLKLLIAGIIEKKVELWEVQSIHFGYNLNIFSKPIHLNLPENLRLDLIEEETYQHLLWSLVAASSISVSTSKFLKKNHLSELIQYLNVKN